MIGKLDTPFVNVTGNGTKMLFSKGIYCTREHNAWNITWAPINDKTFQ